MLRGESLGNWKHSEWQWRDELHLNELSAALSAVEIAEYKHEILG